MSYITRSSDDYINNRHNTFSLPKKKERKKKKIKYFVVRCVMGHERPKAKYVLVISKTK